MPLAGKLASPPLHIGDAMLSTADLAAPIAVSDKQQHTLNLWAIIIQSKLCRVKIAVVVSLLLFCAVPTQQNDSSVQHCMVMHVMLAKA